MIEPAPANSRSIPQSQFAGDDGRPDAALATAIAAGSKYATAKALRDARIFVPVIAILDSAEEVDGHQVEKDSHMATVSVTSASGRKGMVAFTAAADVSVWRKEARPVAAAGPIVVAAALAEDNDALILDPHLSQPMVIELPGLIAILEERDWTPPIGDPEVHEAIKAALTPLVTKCGCLFELSPSPGADLELTIRPDPADQSGLTAGQLTELAARALAEDPLLRSRLGGGIALRLGAALA